MKHTSTIGLVAALSVSTVQTRAAAPSRENRWRPAQATMAVNIPLLFGTSPRPTAAPVPLRFREKRGTTDNTCGYVDGVTESALGCVTTDLCVRNSNYNVIGCCPDTSTDCPLPTTCYDLSELASSTIVNPQALFCSDSSYPSCIQHLYADATFSGYILWDCARGSGRTDTVYYQPLDVTTTSSSSRSARRTSTTTEADTTETTDSPTTSSASVSQIATLSSASASGAPPPVVTGTSTLDPDTTTTPEKKKTPIGAIVGGAVGGVGALALLATAIFLLLRRKKKNDQPPAPTAPAPGQQQQAGYYNPSSPPPPQMVQQQQQAYPSPQGGQQPGYPPVVDPRASIAKPVTYYDQQQYEPNAQQYVQSPNSPYPPQYGSASPPPGAGAGFTPSPVQTYQAGQQYAGGGALDGYGQAQQQHGQQAGGYQFAAELPAHRGDGELRELA